MIKFLLVFIFLRTTGYLSVHLSNGLRVNGVQTPWIEGISVC